MCLNCSLGLINGPPAAPFVSLEVFSHGVGHCEWALRYVVPFFSARLRSPPPSRRFLRLRVAKHPNLVAILQIIPVTNPMFGIPAIGSPTSREPRASSGPPPVAQRKSLFQSAPIGLSADRKSEAGGPCF